MIRLYPTEKTRALEGDILQVMETWQQHVLQDLSEEDLIMLETLLDKIRQRALEEGDD